MEVSFIDFTKLHHEDFRNKIKERINHIIDTNQFIEGQYNDLFESEFAQMQKSKHALLVGNGTDALEICLQISDIKHGDKVAVPAISFYASCEAVLNRFADIVFVDVHPETGLIDPESFKRVLAKHSDIKAVMPVHIYGMPANIKELENIIGDRNIAIIEDGAQASGAFYHTGPVGSSGHLTTFSFYPTKNISAFGDAGAILTNSDKMKDQIVSIRNHGRSPEGYIHIGRNSRCDHIQAAVLHLKLSEIEEGNLRRKEIAKRYFKNLKDVDLQLLPDEFLETSSWHLFPIRVKPETREKLAQFLKEKNIGHTLGFYPRSLSDENLLKHFPGESEVARKFTTETICLPMHPHLEDKEIDYVCEQIKNFY